MTQKKSLTVQAPVGILARYIPDNPKPLGKQTLLVTGFFSAAKILGRTMAVFHPDDLLNDDAPRGWMYQDGNWINERFKKPAVLYDRFYSSMTGPDKRINMKKHRLEEEEKLTFVNPLKMAETATDKLAFAGFLKQNGIPGPDILESSIPDPELLWDTLKAAGEVIIKPRYGRMGRGIMRLIETRTGVEFQCSTGRYPADNPWHLSGLIQSVVRMNGLEHHHFIVQKSIQLPASSPRYFDIRVLMQRTSGAAPVRISGEVARVGGAGIHVPNIDFGGLAMPLPQWLDRVFGRRASRLYASLHRLAFSAYEAVECCFGKTGELGLDMLIDDACKIWLVEMNSKPGRIAFERLASGFGLSETDRHRFAEQRKKSILNPVTYAAWLADHKGD